MFSKTERMPFASCVDESCNIITRDHLEEKEFFVDAFIFAERRSVYGHEQVTLFITLFAFHSRNHLQDTYESYTLGLNIK